MIHTSWQKSFTSAYYIYFIDVFKENLPIFACNAMLNFLPLGVTDSYLFVIRHR